MGVVATQLMDASPEVGVGEMSGACKLGETPGDQPTVTSKNHHFYFRRLHFY